MRFSVLAHCSCGFLLPLLAALLLPDELFAAKGKPAPKKPNHSAQIQALEHHKREILNQEKAHLHQIETHFKTTLEQLHQQKGQIEKNLRQKLEAEMHQTLQRIDDHLKQKTWQKLPYPYWGELTKSLQVAHGVVRMLEHADHDYGGHKGAALKSLKAAVRTLEHRVNDHTWGKTHADELKNTRQTEQELQTAETDLQAALTYAIAKYGTSTPTGAKESQLKSNQQLSEAVTLLANVRQLVIKAVANQTKDGPEFNQLHKEMQAEKQKLKAAYEGRIKNMDKEVTQHIQQHAKQLEQQKHQAIAHVKAQTHAAVQQINQQIALLKK